ncbi:hypothetical protein F7725_025719 [Dissostichus mawsoni]|uniref:Uncharacterized protein n=1 Tax=Dissostichus mawsoni TaxID=36200 RepID=A0A7J5X515_DISMA|nr:hypothetical protein F7725_025719 [Dissostichus mawsoni]
MDDWTVNVPVRTETLQTAELQSKQNHQRSRTIRGTEPSVSERNRTIRGTEPSEDQNHQRIRTISHREDQNHQSQRGTVPSEEQNHQRNRTISLREEQNHQRNTTTSLREEQNHLSQRGTEPSDSERNRTISLREEQYHQRNRTIRGTEPSDSERNRTIKNIQRSVKGQSEVSQRLENIQRSVRGRPLTSGRSQLHGLLDALQLLLFGLLLVEVLLQLIVFSLSLTGSGHHQQVESVQRSDHSVAVQNNVLNSDVSGRSLALTSPDPDLQLGLVQVLHIVSDEPVEQV